MHLFGKLLIYGAKKNYYPYFPLLPNPLNI